MIKVLYTALKHDYMRPEQGFSLEHYNFYNTLKNMDNIEVIYFPYDRMLEVGRDQMNSELRELVRKENPDILFAVMFTNELKKEILKDITDNTNTKTIAWFSDDQWRFDNYSKEYAGYFNLITTTDLESVEKYRKAGQKNVIKTQWACNQFLYKPVEVEEVYDSTFIGQPHGKRKQFINEVRKSGIKVDCWGKGWLNGRVSQEDMIKLFSQSKINLNFIKVSKSFSIRAFLAVFLRKKDGKIMFHKLQHIPSNFKNMVFPNDQIKARNFEIPGCKTFFLTEYAEGIEEYYDIDKEIVCFKNIKELIEKIKYYLNHKEEREQIALAGYKRTLKDHTYEQRFSEIFNFAKQIH